jgi:hypothetical protein
MGGDRRKTVICAILWFSDDILGSSALVVAVSDNYENRIFSYRDSLSLSSGWRVRLLVLRFTEAE